MIRLILILPWILLSPGCTVTEVSPELDMELTEKGRAYLDRHPVRWVDLHGFSGWSPQGSGEGSGPLDPLIIVGPLEYKGALGVHLPWLLTLGIIPGGGTRHYEQAIVIKGPDGDTVDLRHIHVTSYGGWLVSLIALSPNWELGRGPRGDELDSRAFFTAINDLAEAEGIPVDPR